jgi:hypothetical protein
MLMRIEKKTTGNTPFKNVSIGQAFLCSYPAAGTFLYIKTDLAEHRQSLQGVSNAVRLDNGWLSFFFDDTIVKVVDAIITYEE